MAYFGAVKLWKKHDCWIDSRIFRLHYKLSATILLFIAIFATTQMFGTPIDCSVDIAIPADVMNTYCWISSTYTLPGRLGHAVGSAVVAPGVGSRRTADEPEEYHKYYQWVVFVLILQAILFYVPHYIWKMWENERLCMLLNGMHRKEMRGELPEEIVRTASYLSREMSNNNLYYVVYTVCETLNLVNVIAQIFFIDRFLGYEFTTYGTKVFQFLEQDSSERIDPMDKVFPKVTKCTFHRYGPSGNIVNYDGLCILPLNILNEKIYIFLWFWFIILAVISGICLLYRIATFLLPGMRTSLLKSAVVSHSGKPYRLDATDSAIEVIMNRYSFGDWFVLYQMSDSMLMSEYQKLIIQLARNFGWKQPKQE